MDNAKLVYLDDIKDLRDRTEKGYVKEKLKSSFLGGFAKSSVMDFINELRESELRTRETFSDRISELTAGLQEARGDAESLKAELESESLLKRKVENELKDIRIEYELLINKNTKNEKILEEYKEKCSGYEKRINELAAEDDEIDAAKSLLAEYETLKTDYGEAARLQKEYSLRCEVLQKENADVKNQNEKLNKENELLCRNSASLSAAARKSRLGAEMKTGAYTETQKYELENLIKYAKSALERLNEMNEQLSCYGTAIKEELSPLYNLPSADTPEEQ